MTTRHLIVLSLSCLAAALAAWLVVSLTLPNADDHAALQLAAAPPRVSTSTVLEATPLYRITGSYPSFGDLEELDAAVASYVSSSLAEFRAAVGENWDARRATASPGEGIGEWPAEPYPMEVRWTAATVSTSSVSVVVRFSSYEGGANTHEDLRTFNYDVSRRRFLSLSDLFPDDPRYLETLAGAAQESLAARLGADAVFHEGLAPTPENFSSFVFTRSEVTILFPKYQVAPGAAGEQSVTVRRSP